MQLVTTGPYLLLRVYQSKSPAKDNSFVFVGVTANLSGVISILIYLFASCGCCIEFSDNDVMAASHVSKIAQLFVCAKH